MTGQHCAVLARARRLAAALVYEPLNLFERVEHALSAQSVALDAERARLDHKAE